MGVPRLQIPSITVLHERVIEEACGAVVVRVGLDNQLPWNVIGIYKPRLVAGAVVHFRISPAVEVLHDQNPVAGHLLYVRHRGLRVKTQTQHIPLIQPIRQEHCRRKGESRKAVVTGLHVVLRPEAHTVRERAVA